MKPKGSLPCSQQPANVPIMCQMNSIHALPSYFLMIHFDTTFPSTPRSWKQHLPLRFSYQNYVGHLSSMRTTRSVHLILLQLVTLVIFGEECEL
jgi:hypothetical protein